MPTAVLPSDAGSTPRSATTRWFGVGRSALPESERAGAAAAEQAVCGADGKLIVVFASPSHDLAALLTGVRSRTAGIPLIGCSTAGEIATDGPSDGGVVVVALGGPGFVARTAVARGGGGIAGTRVIAWLGPDEEGFSIDYPDDWSAAERRRWRLTSPTKSVWTRRSTKRHCPLRRSKRS